MSACAARACRRARERAGQARWLHPRPVNPAPGPPTSCCTHPPQLRVDAGRAGGAVPAPGPRRLHLPGRLWQLHGWAPGCARACHRVHVGGCRRGARPTPSPRPQPEPASQAASARCTSTGSGTASPRPSTSSPCRSRCRRGWGARAEQHLWLHSRHCLQHARWLALPAPSTLLRPPCRPAAALPNPPRAQIMFRPPSNETVWGAAWWVKEPHEPFEPRATSPA